MATTNKNPWRSDLFDGITTNDELDNALYELSGVFCQELYVAILDHFFEHPIVVEIILSAPMGPFSLNQCILDGFSLQPDDFTSSFSWKLLSRLSNFFQFQSLPLPDGTTDVVAQYDRMVNSVPYILHVFSGMSLFENDDHGSDFTLSKAKKNRKAKQQAREVPSEKWVDAAILRDFSVSTPTKLEEKEKAIADVLRVAKTILGFYLELLVLPVVTNALRRKFLSQAPSASPLRNENREEAKINTPTIDAPSAYPFVQPLKSARYFSNAEGFGEWRILISTRADSDLREARRKDPTSFKIIVKKIKELSNGHFSDDNHKRLNGPNTDVPIFEAKMTRDSRLVYQIDSMSDYDREVEHQVIRVFGIYTHAQMDNSRLWSSVGRQLGQKGREYIRRCMVRQPAKSGDKVFLPASFPAPEEQEASPKRSFLDLPPDDLEEIHSLLVLEKYLTFSQELLKSIIANLDVSFPFQVSPQERDIIEFPYSCFVLGRSGTGKTTTMLFKMLWIERTHQLNSDSVPKPRQIFVTKSRVLAGKVEEYFIKLLDTLQTASKSLVELKKGAAFKTMQSKFDGLVDLDDDDHWHPDLPKKFSELQDSAFPLFITFDTLCDLIEADFDPCERISYMKLSDQPRTLVSFELFQREYWPHFSQPLTKGLEPALVFSEILGVIMGSEEAASTSLGYLDRNTYETLSERRQSTFASQRSTIYSLFELYHARKRQRGDFDTADRTHAIIQMFAKRGIVGRKVDQLCVDEAQDNLLSDALVLRSLCHNANGLFWAGDTAQTISVGSSFRFDDLKSFLYRIEKRRLETQSTAQKASKPPKTFQLATNYRSHAGIVNCAHAVIELITRFWPNAIDSLAPEKGIVEGLKPIFLYGWDNDSVRYEQFLFGASGDNIEFGAQQCILVRDDVARQRLRSQVGDIGMIMTLYESKGLEFNDVLLYNFFEDSSVEHSQWRIVLSVSGAEEDDNGGVPQFHHVRHAVVCNELKFLYVAITRARKNLWIADQSNKGEPMRTYWSTKDQIHSCTPGEDLPRLAVRSSPEEWAIKGKELFERKRYLQAEHCYERAEMPREKAISHAYFLRDEARKVPLGDSRRAKDKHYAAFLAAAEGFLLCAEDDAEQNRLVYFRRAGECLETAQEDFRAASAYLEAHDYDVAAKLFRKIGLFDEAINVIKANEQYMKTEVVDNIREVARLYYFREKKLKQARELFATDDDELEYLEDLDLDIARAEVLQLLERYTEAAEVHLSEGRPMVAIPLMLKDDKNEHSARQAASVIVQQLWCNVSFGNFINQPLVSQLLQWSARLNWNLLEEKQRKEISMFNAIISNNKQTLAHLARSFLSTNRTAAALCLNYYFMKFPDLKTMTIHDLPRTLELFLAHIQILSELAFRFDPSSFPPAAHLFGFRRLLGDEFLIPTGTFLHRFFNQKQPTTWQQHDQDVTVSTTQLSEIYREAIREHLCQTILEENDLCRSAPSMSTCISFAVLGYCRRTACSQGLHEHISSSAITADWYNARVRVHLQQILIIQTLQSMKGRNLVERRRWINRLYETLNPSFHYLGSQFYLNPASIPEFQRGIQVVKYWVEELAYTLDYGSQQFFLTDLIRAAVLGLSFDKSSASIYWQPPRARCLLRPVPPFVRPPNNILPRDLVRSLEGVEDWSIFAGMLSLLHILDANLPVNVGVLCDLIEFLCASSVIATNVGWRRQGFHGITLPHSFLLQHITVGDYHGIARKAINIAFIFKFLDSLKELLETIFTGVRAEYLLFDGGNLSTIAGIRSIFIARICRAVCLLGYNTPSPQLRFKVLGTITSLRRDERVFNVLYRHYVYARDWDELVRALRGAGQGSLPDPLVQLHDLRRAPRPSVLRGVLFLTYRDDADLPHLLKTVCAPEATRVENHPHGSQLVESDGVRERVDTANVENAEMPEESNTNVGGFTDAEMSSIPAAGAPLAHSPTEDEVKSALKIQRAYRDMMSRRSKLVTKARDQARQRFFKQCLGCAQELGWKQNSYYRLLFLGPLPHLLVCLETASTAIAAQKTKAKKRLPSERHQDLDELGLELTRLRNLYKTLCRLQKTLQPTSNIHSDRDMGGLERLVREAVELLQTIPLEELSHDLEIADKAILVRKKLPEVPPKPNLVLDDEDLYIL